jgi:hypothetical protein
LGTVIDGECCQLQFRVASSFADNMIKYRAWVPAKLLSILPPW